MFVPRLLEIWKQAKTLLTSSASPPPMVLSWSSWNTNKDWLKLSSHRNLPARFQLWWPGKTCVSKGVKIVPNSLYEQLQISFFFFPGLSALMLNEWLDLLLPVSPLLQWGQSLPETEAHHSPCTREQNQLNHHVLAAALGILKWPVVILLMK